MLSNREWLLMVVEEDCSKYACLSIFMVLFRLTVGDQVLRMNTTKGLKSKYFTRIKY